MIAEDFTIALKRVPLGPSSHVVVVTRGHDHDSECLEAILPKETAYIGLIGSRRRIRFVLEALAEKGHPPGSAHRHLYPDRAPHRIGIA